MNGVDVERCQDVSRCLYRIVTREAPCRNPDRH